MSEQIARLVLVHGSLVSSAQWVNYPQLLGDEIEVVTPELPGHGRRMNERFTVEQTLRTIDEAVGRSDLPTILAGHSLGGYMALAWAEHHSHRLAGLAMIGATGDPSARGAGFYRRFARSMAEGGTEHLDARVLRNLHRVVPPDTIDAVRENGVSYAGSVDAWPAVLDGITPQMLTSVDCPVLLLAGQFDQMRIHSKRFAAQAKLAHRVLIPRATHMAPMTHQAQTASALREFVDDVLAIRARR